MLVLFERIVQRSRWFRGPAFVALAAMLAVCAWVLVWAPMPVQDEWLIPTIVLTLWLLLCASTMTVFTNVPLNDYQNLGWTGKIRRKLVRFCFHLLAWFMLIVSLALLVVSFQLLMAWFRGP